MLENQICELLANRNVNPSIISEVRKLCSGTVFDTLDTIGRTLYESPVSLETVDFPAEATMNSSQTIDMFTLEPTEYVEIEETKSCYKIKQVSVRKL